MRLAGQHALVTGGGTGIGAAIARALAEQGAKITMIGRRVEPLKATAAELAGQGFEDIYFTTCDVTDPLRVRAAIRYARDRNRRIDILVNNAGQAGGEAFGRITPELWRERLAVNLDGVFHCCQAALADLLAAQRGRIVTIASTAGLRGYAYTAPYVAAKHGAVGLMRALAVEFTKTGLTANAVCPGFTDTDLVAGAVANIRSKTGRSEEEAKAELAKLNPSGRLIAPAEIAALVLELILSDRNGEAVELA